MPTNKILDFLYKGAIAGNPEYFNQAVGMPEHYDGQQDPTTEGATQLASNLKDIGIQGAWSLMPTAMAIGTFAHGAHDANKNGLNVQNGLEIGLSALPAGIALGRGALNSARSTIGANAVGRINDTFGWTKNGSNAIGNVALNSKRMRQYLRDVYVRDAYIHENLEYPYGKGPLIHGDPVATGVKRASTAIGESDGKPISFPHFNNGYFVAGNHEPLTVITQSGTQRVVEPTIFWGKDVPFFETRGAKLNDNSFTQSLDDVDFRQALLRGDPNQASSAIIQHPYRYITTPFNKTKFIQTRQGTQAHPEKSEFIGDNIPISDLIGHEWNPLTKTWGRVIYTE